MHAWLGGLLPTCHRCTQTTQVADTAAVVVKAAPRAKRSATTAAAIEDTAAVVQQEARPTARLAVTTSIQVRPGLRIFYCLISTA